MTRVGSCAVFVMYDPVRTNGIVAVCRSSPRCWIVRASSPRHWVVPESHFVFDPGTGCLGQSHPKKHFKQNKIRSGVCHVCPGPSSSLPCPLRPQPCTMNVFRVFDGFSSHSGLQLRPSQEDVHDLSHRHSMLSLLFPSEKRCALLGCHERATHSL